MTTWGSNLKRRTNVFCADKYPGWMERKEWFSLKVLPKLQEMADKGETYYKMTCLDGARDEFFEELWNHRVILSHIARSEQIKMFGTFLPRKIHPKDPEGRNIYFEW